jgi:hypothetical protein
VLWSSEDPRYGGSGQPPLSIEAAWVLPGHAALLLGPGPASPSRRSEQEKALRATAIRKAEATKRAGSRDRTTEVTPAG